MKLRRKRNSFCSRSAALLLALLLALSSLSVLFTGCSDAETQAVVEEAANSFVDGLPDAPETVPHDTAPSELTETASPVDTEVPPPTAEPEQPDEHTYYYSKDDVALYLHVYGHLPDNYITKNEAQKRGWDSSKGNLWDVADGFCIGGDRFGNYEGLLPKNNGTYYECDVDYAGGYRGADRLIFDTKGDIWYTGDHYASFDKLY